RVGGHSASSPGRRRARSRPTATALRPGVPLPTTRASSSASASAAAPASRRRSRGRARGDALPRPAFFRPPPSLLIPRSQPETYLGRREGESFSMRRAARLLLVFLGISIPCGLALAGTVERASDLIDGAGMLNYMQRPTFTVGTWVKYRTLGSSEQG